jgi:hypothetical protein
MAQHKRKPNHSGVNIEKAGIEEMFEAIPSRGRGEKLWHFQFGPYTGTDVFVWGGSLEDGLEIAAGWLKEHAPGHFHEPDYADAAKEHGLAWPSGRIDWDDPKVQKVTEQAEADLTYTESGFLASWAVNELHEGDETYAEVWEKTIDELSEQGDLDEDKLEEVNKFAEKLGLDAEWEPDDGDDADADAGTKENPHMVPAYYKGKAWDVESNQGGWLVLDDVHPVGKHRTGYTTDDPAVLKALEQYVEGEPTEATVVSGWFAQLTAPGYMDQTEWSGPYNTKKEAEDYIAKQFDVDPRTGEGLEDED